MLTVTSLHLKKIKRSNRSKLNYFIKISCAKLIIEDFREDDFIIDGVKVLLRKNYLSLGDYL